MSLFPPDDWVTVGQSQLEIVAEMMRSRLEAEGIEAVLRGNKASGAAGVINELNISWDNPLGGVEVRVHQSDEEAARAILAEVETEDEFSPIGDEPEETEGAAQAVRPFSWIRLYFQIFCSLIIGLWAFAAVTAWSQNPNVGLGVGLVAFILFMISSFLPRK